MNDISIKICPKFAFSSFKNIESTTISILDPLEEKTNHSSFTTLNLTRTNGFGKFFICHFEDTETKTSISESQANMLANFIKDRISQGDVNFLIHCTAGQSRSNAVARAIFDYAKHLGMQMDWNEFVRENPQQAPNLYVYNSITKRLIYD